MKPVKTVFDTNVWISGIAFEGVVRKVLLLAIEGKVEVAVSPAILREIEKVLSGKKFGYPSPAVASILYEIQNFAVVVHPEKSLAVVRSDPSDDRILECALQAKAGFLVSGDQHLLAMKKYGEIKILSPSEFLAEQ